MRAPSSHNRPPRRPAGRFRNARLWLWLNVDSFNVLLVLVLTAALVAALSAGLFWLVRPVGPDVAFEGQVVGLGVKETDLGSVPTASVQIEGETVRIWMNKHHGCRIGDVIQLRRRPTRWGHLIGPAPMPQPCSTSSAVVSR